MSLNHQNPEPVILKEALHWLNQQPDNWAEYIKDSNIAVKMYLKSQNRRNKSSFQKEIQQFVTKEEQKNLKEPAGAVLAKKPPPPLAPVKSPPSPPLDWLSSRPAPLKELEKKTEPIFLDQKSLEALENTKRELNIKDEEEALRLLIQIGRKSLNKLIAPAG